MGWICNGPWQQCSEFALHWLMRSCSRDGGCCPPLMSLFMVHIISCMDGSILTWVTPWPERHRGCPHLHTAHESAQGSSEFSCSCFRPGDCKPGLFDIKGLISLIWWRRSSSVQVGSWLYSFPFIFYFGTDFFSEMWSIISCLRVRLASIDGECGSPLIGFSEKCRRAAGCLELQPQVIACDSF